MVLAWRMVAAASGDRKGATSLEYAMIVGAMAPIVLAAFSVFFERLDTYFANFMIG